MNADDPKARIANLDAIADRRGGIESWIEWTAVAYLAVLLVVLLVRFERPGRMVVLNHGVRKGTTLQPEDVRLAAVTPLDQSFRDTGVVKAMKLTVVEPMDAGAPLRWSSVQRLQVVATKAIAAEEAISNANVALRPTPYDDAAMDAIPSGVNATLAIPANATLHKDMVKSFVSPASITKAPAEEHARQGEVEMALKIAVATPVQPPADVTLFIPRKDKPPLMVDVRLLSVDSTAKTVVVAVPANQAADIAQSMPADAYVARRGKH